MSEASALSTPTSFSSSSTGASSIPPSFGGVYWDTLDLPLEDIDRIEVIRGPGGSVWGANAVNGVISLSLTLGTKLAHNDYTGLGVMPTARVTWTPGSRYTVWAAFSRAIRTPARSDTGLLLNLGGSDSGNCLVLTRLSGNPDFEDEKLFAYEAGYRAGLSGNLDLDVSAYYNDYDDLSTVEPGGFSFENAPAPPHGVFLLTYQNLMRGETHGLEASLNWKVNPQWTLSPGYSFKSLHMHTAPRAPIPLIQTSSSTEPRGTVRSCVPS